MAKLLPGFKQIGRIAFREEGKSWNAYYALPDTMKGSLFLGSVVMAGIVGHPERKKAFMQLMRDIVSDIIENQTGTRPTWPEPDGTPAPESERTKG